MKRELDYKGYINKYYNKIDSLTEKEFVKAIEFLKGKSVSDEYEIIEDCAVHFISRLLTIDWGRSIVIEYTKEQRNFIKSNYLSNYFKDSIKEMLGDSISNELLNILNSEKNINEMTEKEIKTIRNEIDKFFYINGQSEKPNISSRFMSYITKLNGSGIISYIKNNIQSSELAKQILYTSGLNARSSYYSGRGVNYGDLNDSHLAAIYKKLLVLDKNYAENYVWLVDNIRTLGATEFIDSFINLGHAGFDYTKFDVRSNSNISLDGLEGNSLLAVGAISLFESRRNRRHGFGKTEAMKLSFHKRIDHIRTKALNNLEVTEEDYELSKNVNYVVSSDYDMYDEDEFVYRRR